MPVTINGSGSIVGLAAGGISDAGAIASGVITSSALPTGSVVQVKHTQTKSNTNSGSSSYVNIGALDVSITPTSSSNLLIFQYNMIVRVRENSEHGAFAWIAVSDDGGSSYLAQNYHRNYDYGGNGCDLDCGACGYAIKTAGSTSARTYKIYMKLADGDSFEVNPAGNQNNSAVTVMEIAA